jgi:putative glycosyltransferase (TIGR04348 family)
MVALHAWRSAAAIKAFTEAYPEHPLIVVLTGTDAYRFIHSHPEETRASLSVADRIVGLHRKIADCVPAADRQKLRVIFQSAKPLGGRKAPRSLFRVCVAGHLRDEKDSLRAALAVRDLPAASRIQVDAYGKPHNAEWASAARAEAATNARYHWHGEIAHGRLRDVYRRSHLLALTSRMEGGANVISEAVMAGLPVVASRIPGSVGLLGEDYPGYYPVEDTDALRDLLLRAEADADFYAGLERACAALRPLFTEQAESSGWAQLLSELG